MNAPAVSSASLVSLSDVQASLALFAEAIVGHPVSIEAVDEAQPCWPMTPSLLGSGPVLVPTAIDDCDSDELNRTAFRSVVLHQIVTLEQPPLETVEAYVRAPNRAQLDRILTMLEDLRAVAIARHRYPGSATDLERVLAHALDQQRTPEETGDERLLAVMRRRSLGADAGRLLADFPEIGAPAIEALLAEVAPVERPTATARDSVAAAIRICRLVSVVANGGLESFLDEEEAVDDPGLAGDELTGLSLGSVDPSADVELSEGLMGGWPATDVPAPQAQMSSPEGEDAAIGLTFPAGSSAERRIGEVRTFVYDEWDYRAQDHRRAWCRVVEERLVGEDFAFIADVRSRHFALRSRIRRTFSKLRPSDLVRVHRSDDGEELDLDAAIEAVADRRGGAPVDDRLHIRRDRAARDVATAFLVDLSGSTSSPVDPPERPPPVVDPDPFDDPMSYEPMYSTPGRSGEPERRVIDVAKDAVALMSDALHELSDQHAIYGFSGSGRDNVEFKVAKDFGDRVSANSWAALAEMDTLRYTRMGPAIRHTVSKLAAQSARTKLLIVISDGYPQDTDYGDHPGDREYGIQDTGRALADAAVEGIDPFCVTIDPAGHDYLRRMCPDHRYLVIDDVKSLPEELAKLYLTLSSN